MRLNLGNIELEIDVEATRQAYAKVELSGPDDCTCPHCQNWVAQRDKIFPQEIIELLVRMGIKPGCESQVSVIDNSDGRLDYWGSYPFVGNIIKGNKQTFEYPDLSLFAWEGFAHPFDQFPTGRTQELNFRVKLDWVLEDPASVPISKRA